MWHSLFLYNHIEFIITLSVTKNINAIFILFAIIENYINIITWKGRENFYYFNFIFYLYILCIYYIISQSNEIIYTYIFNMYLCNSLHSRDLVALFSFDNTLTLSWAFDVNNLCKCCAFSPSILVGIKFLSFVYNHRVNRVMYENNSSFSVWSCICVSTP